MHAIFLAFYRLFSELVLPRLIALTSAQQAHERVINLLAWLDGQTWLHPLLVWMHDLAFVERSLLVGGVKLRHPLILAAGFVKGDGFADEDAASQAVQRNIIPGWRSMPLLVGAVEFGSFTRYPRLGNSGVVLWRDAATHSTQNRVGLKNPGALAAAEFLAQHRRDLPPIFGINIAVSPGVTDPDQGCNEVLESLSTFLERGIRPSWFTLNLSCPNTHDDPGSHQTEDRARALCESVVALLDSYDIPLWVKISPALAAEQYRVLLSVFSETGVRAVIATNTLAAPAPDGTTAGLAGGRLHQAALEAVDLLTAEKAERGCVIDIIACGGVSDGTTYHDFANHGVKAMQYYSTFIYRGPLAAALIEQESRL